MVVSLNYLSNFWQSFELKLKWMNHWVLSVVDNDNADTNNITFTIKDTKFYVPTVTYQTNAIKNYQKFLAKGLKYQCIGMNRKRKARTYIFSNQIL